jgi:DNA-binding response OmpR family regulator
VDVYVRKLREKVEVGVEPKLLHSVKGIGYTMKP